MNGSNERLRMQKPKLAIVESNTLAVMGLKQLLETAIPFAQIEAFGTFGEVLGLRSQAFHPLLCIVMQMYSPTALSSLDHKHKTIVLTPSNDPKSHN